MSLTASSSKQQGENSNIGTDECPVTQQLLQKIQHKADIELVFHANTSLKDPEDGCAPEKRRSSTGANADASTINAVGAGSNARKLEINSYMLSTHSSVLAPIIDVALSEGSSSDRVAQVPICGTTRDDFITLMSFVYPMNPLPKVTWDNLEVLLVEGNKWDMQLPLAHASEFIQSYGNELNMTPDSKMFALKWLRLADQAGLHDASKMCASALIRSHPSMCKQEHLEGLSPKTLMYMIECFAGHGRLRYPCKYCNTSRR